MKLWCGFFHHVTHQRRRNVMQLTDPDFIEMLDDNSNLNEEEFESLFGKYFLSRVVKEAEDEEALNRHRVEHQRHNEPAQRGNVSSGRRLAGGSSCFQQLFSSNRGSVDNRYVLIDFIGGRLQFFAHKWKVISDDPWIFNTIKSGLRIVILEKPIQHVSPVAPSVSKEIVRLCEE